MDTLSKPNKAETEDRRIDSLTFKVGEYQSILLGSQISDQLLNLIELLPYYGDALTRMEKEAPSPMGPFLRMIEMLAASFKQALDASPEVKEDIENAKKQHAMRAMFGGMS
jgi:hypothetical protein